MRDVKRDLNICVYTYTCADVVEVFLTQVVIGKKERERDRQTDKADNKNPWQIKICNNLSFLNWFLFWQGDLNLVIFKNYLTSRNFSWYSVTHLMWSLLARLKLMTLTEW